MSKVKTLYICQNCGANSPKWIGNCPACHQWNTYVEEVVISKTGSNIQQVKLAYETKPININQIEISEEARINTENNEFNRVLGGGMVPGSIILIGGEPGIGKSTLALQIALTISAKTLYISGEESLQQIKLRANRLENKKNVCDIYCETSIEKILLTLTQNPPEFIVIDSIQTMQTDKVESSPGTVTQIKECTNMLIQFCKPKAIPVVLIGHINKEGNLAGPKILEHMVDTVLLFEGDRNFIYRILRSAKNRFGSTSEIGIFEMRQNGLLEVNNPSELLLSQRDTEISGVSIAASIEGIRPFLIEIQALVSTAAYGIPQRSATGFDLRRLNMLLAVLEKRAGFRLAQKDVFLNIAGGIKVNDPAIDMAVIASVLASNHDIAIPKNCCFAAEIGLTGEIRPVTRIDQRITEAEKLGFTQIYISKYNTTAISNKSNLIKIIPISRIEQLIAKLFS